VTPTTNITKETIMNTQSAIPCPKRLTDQPTHWPTLHFLPQTHYVQRQRAANAPEYNPSPQPAMPDYRPTNKKQSYLHRCTAKFTAARRKAWLSLKRFGREVIHCLVKWCLLPLAIAACFAMVDVAPAELPVDYYTIEDTYLVER
jgi:hypothetical protein